MVAPLTFSLSVFTSLPFFLAAFSLPSPPSPPLSESSPSFDSSLVDGSVERRTEVREPNATGTDFFFPLRSSSLESWKEEVKSWYYAWSQITGWNCLNLTWNMEFNRSQLRHWQTLAKIFQINIQKLRNNLGLINRAPVACHWFELWPPLWHRGGERLQALELLRQNKILVKPPKQWQNIQVVSQEKCHTSLLAIDRALVGNNQFAELWPFVEVNVYFHVEAEVRSIFWNSSLIRTFFWCLFVILKFAIGIHLEVGIGCLTVLSGFRSWTLGFPKRCWSSFSRQCLCPLCLWQRQALKQAFNWTTFSHGALLSKYLKTGKTRPQKSR